MRKLVVLSMLVAGLAAPSAFAKSSFSLAGNLNYGLTEFTGMENALGFGGGATVEFNLGKSTGFDLGAHYVVRKSKIGGVDFEASAIHAPGGFRFWFSPKVSMLLGGFYDHNLEDTGDESTHGLLGGFRFLLGRNFFLEPRFNYGLEKILDKNPMEGMLFIGWTFGK